MRDKIVRQTFSGSDKTWEYTIHTQFGRKYTVAYEVLPYGYCREILRENGFCIWDREFKIGEPLNQTIYEVIYREESLAV